MLWPKPIPAALLDRVPVFEGSAPAGTPLPFVEVAREPGSVCVHTAVWNETGERAPHLGLTDRTTRWIRDCIFDSEFGGYEPEAMEAAVAFRVRAAQCAAAVATLTHDLLLLDWPLEPTDEVVSHAGQGIRWVGVRCPLLPGFWVGRSDGESPARERIVSDLISTFTDYVAAGQWQELAEVRAGTREPFEADESILQPPPHEHHFCDDCGDCHGCVPLDGTFWPWEGLE